MNLDDYNAETLDTEASHSGNDYALPNPRLTAEEEALCFAVRASEADAGQLRQLRRLGRRVGIQEASPDLTATALLVLSCEGTIWDAVRARKGSQGIAEDLAAEARMEVLKALDAFKHQSRFNTYAYSWIIGGIIEAESKLRYGVSMPALSAQLGNRAYFADSDMSDVDRTRGDAALVTMYGVDGLSSMTDAGEDAEGFPDEWGGDPEDPAAEFEDQVVDAIVAKDAIIEAMHGLSDNHREVIEMKYLGGRTMDDAEVALLLGVERAAVTRMLGRAREELRDLARDVT